MIHKKLQTINSEVLNRIEAEMRKAIYIDKSSLIFRSISADINKLLKVDPFQGHIANSYLYHLAGDFENVNNCLNIASKIGDNKFVEIQRSTALVNLGYFSESKALFEKFADPEYGNFHNDVVLGYATFSFKHLNKWFEKAKKMLVDLSTLDSMTCLKASNILSSAKVTEAKLAEMADISGEILREKNIFTVGPTEFVIEEDPLLAPCIYVTFRVNGTPEDAADLYDEFINRLITKVDSIPSEIHFAFRAAE